MTLALGVLVSGSGSNLQAILDAIETGRLDAKVQVVISNRDGVRALDRARDRGIRCHVVSHQAFDSREAFDGELVRTLQQAEVSWVVLAGFMRVLTPVFLDAFQNRVVNIHPSLLPAFPGVDAQRQAFDYGVKLAGCTVHLVDSGVDMGPIIAQAAVPVLDDDDAETLRARILEQEHIALPRVLSWISSQRLSLETTTTGRTIVRVAGADQAWFAPTASAESK